jgi:hypothetical protein
LLVLGLTGCTPGDTGDLAYGRDSDGNVVAVVQMCEGTVESVFVSNGSADYSKEWTFDEPVSDFGMLALAGLDSDLAPGHSYSVYARSKDRSAAADGPPLKLRDVQSLLPGEVLATDTEDDQFPEVVMTVEEFREMVKRRCN